jgi:hypothetical protein
MQERYGDWIGTYTGRQFWPLDPRPDEVCIEDIAHALSQICRFNGHCKRFYSVAEHSLNVETVLKSNGYALRLYALLHDAAEAYVCDIPRPMKSCLRGYKGIEEANLQAIYRAFNLSGPNAHEKKMIKLADNYILAIEARELMNNIDNWTLMRVDSGVSLGTWGNVEKDYVDVFASLLKYRKGVVYDRKSKSGY